MLSNWGKERNKYSIGGKGSLKERRLKFFGSRGRMIYKQFNFIQEDEMEFKNLPKKYQIPVTFNGNSRHTGKRAILTKISGAFSKPEETIVKARLDAGEEVQTRILGLVNPQAILIRLGLQ